jgi:hypothetical protein
MRWGFRQATVLVIAAVILAVGLGVILSSFFREVAPRFTGDLEPLLRAGVALFFVGAVYFLIALVSLFGLRSTSEDDDGRLDDVGARVTFNLKDPATHVAASILILVGSAFLLTLSFARPLEHTGGRRTPEETARTRAVGAPTDALTYYACQGIVTDPGTHADLFDELPRDIDALAAALQGVLLHVYWAEAQGVTLTDERQAEVRIRSVADMLARIRQLDGRPLTEPRDLDSRLVANCRDYAVLLTAMLRHQGVPARARAGFATYFAPGEYTDHWVTEYWNEEQKRWVLVDPQLDELQIRTLGITFNPLDVPEGLFISGGDAWLTCRAGNADPEEFGIAQLRGMSFIRGNIGHDFWALNKVETLPWEGWGVCWQDEEGLRQSDLEFLDRVSRLILDGDESFAALRALHDGDARLRTPRDWPID